MIRVVSTATAPSIPFRSSFACLAGYQAANHCAQNTDAETRSGMTEGIVESLLRLGQRGARPLSR
jgi:hypothetical protein